MASFSIDGRRQEMTMTLIAPADKRPNLRLAAVTVAAVMLTGVWLAGCKTTETADAVPYPYDYKQRHPITLQEGKRTVELFVSRRQSGLTPAQRSNVGGFAQNWHRDAAGDIEIRVPSGTSSDRVFGETIAEIQGILVEAGVPQGGIVVRPSRPADPSQLMPIVLAYPRITAAAGPCGRWPNDLGPGAGMEYDINQPYWNLGCSMQRNLASMVDDPADLVQPRGEAPAYMARRSVVLDKYRKGEDTTTQYRDTDKAKIADVGK
jgi:pilus assembly protein CpaD